MSSHGPGPLVRITPHINSEEYIHILSDVMLSYVAETFPEYTVRFFNTRIDNDFPLDFIFANIKKRIYTILQILKYVERYPNRRHPDANVFLRLINRMSNM
ncbi:hypothetical protein ALC62_07122 [Cyphomyrmex costatus]|uniref:Uncharacterized protein n=1 Tax=Cyphomyrmex costatus TaxID=456900 RepID=A0A151II35_9HYME|nr:hypothetical protein ALC62_07122 [Cyphomyrmex costatus]